ncbi:hypothetical protein EDB86DRAFT_3103794 [Lactarius hatsudake]|nr:hypothetical protein EDB86DRAFT_3103794 [Lactarius hatsudake]
MPTRQAWMYCSTSIRPTRSRDRRPQSRPARALPTPSLTSISACSSSDITTTPLTSDDKWLNLGSSPQLRKAPAAQRMQIHPLVITKSTPALLTSDANVPVFKFTIAPLSDPKTKKNRTRTGRGTFLTHLPTHTLRVERDRRAPRLTPRASSPREHKYRPTQPDEQAPHRTPAHALPEPTTGPDLRPHRSPSTSRTSLTISTRGPPLHPPQSHAAPAPLPAAPAAELSPRVPPAPMRVYSEYVPVEPVIDYATFPSPQPLPSSFLPEDDSDDGGPSEEKLRSHWSPPSVDHARLSFATHRRLRSNAQLFIFSYATNCSAPFLTPTSESDVCPPQPSSWNIARNPPAGPTHQSAKPKGRTTNAL